MTEAAAATATDATTLAERCARALGCNVVAEDGHAYCMCPLDAEGHYGYGGVQVLPYGAETREGWACTGPLIARFSLGLDFSVGFWTCVNVSGESLAVDALTPCQAVAEWVARHGAKASA